MEHNFLENLIVEYLRMDHTAFCFVGLREHQDGTAHLALCDIHF